jgi:hypothetical protein
MNHDYWKKKLDIPGEAEVIFYQNPEFYRSNSFAREYETERKILLRKGLIRWYTISGICNRHHKNDGRRQKVCVVMEKQKLNQF